MKRIITALMTVALVLSLASGLSLTAYAVPEKSRDGEHDLVNFALNMPIEATSAYIAPEGFFAPELLVDGQWGTYDGGANVKLGWNSDTVATIHGEYDEIDITVTMDTYYRLECIVLKPMQWAKGEGFPRDFELQTSTNGRDWKTVASEKDASAVAPSNTEVVPREYPVEPTTVRYFRIHITRSSASQDQGGSMISCLGELELWGFKPDTLPDDVEPITYTATFVAGNQIVAKVDFPGGATSLEEPAVPAKEGYTGVWSAYTLSDKDIVVRAVYTAIETPTETPTEAPTETPTDAPTEAPTAAPTEAPTAVPTEAPTAADATEAPADTDSGTAEPPEPTATGCASAMTVLPAMLVSLCGLAYLRRKH